MSNDQPSTGSTLLATAAPHRILAWPRYDRATDLETLTKTFGPAFAQRSDVCLCLRHDPAIDVPVADAIAAVETALTKAFGESPPFEVLVVDGPLDGSGWAAVGGAVTGIILLPWSWDPLRHARLNGLGHPLMTSGDDLRRHLGAPRTATTTATATTTTTTTATATVAAARSGEPAVSVILPTFNRPEFLQRALDSLVAQTFGDFEVVVVNDGGAAMEAVLDAYATKLLITYVRHGKNRDRSAARNSALAMARGRYIAYLDDDDRYQPDHLETLIDTLRRGNHQIAYSDATWVLEQKGPTGYQTIRPILTRSKPFDVDQLMVANYVPLVSVMHERACVDEVGGFDEQLGTNEDWDLLIRLASRYAFHHVDRVTAQISWREDGSSATSAKPAEFAQTRSLIHQRYRSATKDKPGIVAAQQRVAGGQVASAPVPAPASPRIAQAKEVVREAQSLVERGDLDGACKVLIAALDLAVESVELVVLLADIFVAQGKIKVAGEILEQASLLHPTNIDIAQRLTQQLAGIVIQGANPGAQTTQPGSNGWYAR
jgi:hypothetical protein